MEALRSSETLDLTSATRPNIPEDELLHSHRCENLKSSLPHVVHVAVIKVHTYMLENNFIS
jgi:hypothetical protein